MSDTPCKDEERADVRQYYTNHNLLLVLMLLAALRLTLGIYEVFLQRSGMKIWAMDEPSPEQYIPCYMPRRPKGGERSVARTAAE